MGGGLGDTPSPPLPIDRMVIDGGERHPGAGDRQGAGSQLAAGPASRELQRP